MQDNNLNEASPVVPGINSITAPTASTVSRVSLESAVELMRAEVAVRDDWRASVLREVSSRPQPSLSEQLPEIPSAGLLHRSVSVRPVVALAACALAMVAGSVATLAVVKRSMLNDSAVSTAAARDVVPAATVSSASIRHTVIRFVLVAPGAKSVSIVGDFNAWNPRATPLVPGRDGTTWRVDMPLSAGRHVYAFVVDGDIVADPSAPRVVDHDFGVQNSVVLVGAS